MIDIVIAVIIDLVIGDPENFPHPVRLMGKIIQLEEGFARKKAKSNIALKVSGLFIVIFNMLLTFSVPFFILILLKQFNNIVYHIVNIYFLYTCVAARCLHNEGMKIYKALEKGIEEARYRLSFIVGRDTIHLEAPEIVRAAVETVAENTSDGVIAPLLFAMIGGAPLAVMYKMVNTMDSMLGYTNEKYRYIGFFSAKNDDVFNFIPSRITGFLMCLGSLFRFDTINGIKIMIRDRKNHKSPNCAYPEGAVAGLLGVMLGGDNIYFGELVKKPKIGDEKRQLEKSDIKRTIEIMYRAEFLLLIIYILIGVIL